MPQGMAQSFLQAAREHLAPCTHLVLKNPEMTPLFAEVRELVYEARFLVVIRDPRDTIASILEVAKKQAQAGQTSNFTNIGRDMRRLSQLYNAYYRAVVNTSSESLKSVSYACIWCEKPTVTFCAAPHRSRVGRLLPRSLPYCRDQI